MLHEVFRIRKFEIVRTCGTARQFHLCRNTAPLGLPRSTIDGWYSRYQEGGIEALEDGKPRPRRIWNKIPDEIGTRSLTCPRAA